MSEQYHSFGCISCLQLWIPDVDRNICRRNKKIVNDATGPQALTIYHTYKHTNTGVSGRRRSSHNDRHFITTDSSWWRSFHKNGHFTTTDSLYRQTFHNNGHLIRTDIPNDGHLNITVIPERYGYESGYMNVPLIQSRHSILRYVIVCRLM